MTRIHLLSALLAMLFALPLSAAKPVRVACIGNSITYGMKLDDPSTESYPAQLQRLLGSGYEVGNYGKSGATLLRHGHRPYVEQEEWRKAKASKSDIAIIHLGINDTDPRNWTYYRDEFVADYLAIIDTLRQLNPACRVIVALPTPITYKHPRFESSTRQWREDVKDAIATVAQASGAQLVDFERPLIDYPQLLPDAVHPNRDGARRLALAAYGAVTGNYGGLQMPDVYSDNMVLQRDRQLLIGGTADAGEKVTVELTRASAPTPKAGKGKPRHVRAPKPSVFKAETTADAMGDWSVCLPAHRAEKGLTLTVSTSRRTLSFSNVAYGEVWLCSGQSNMEFMLKEAATAARDIPSASNPDIRLFDMKARWRTNAEEWSQNALDSINDLQYFRQTQWQTCTPETARDFSAIGYYFARMLQDSLQVPVGVICNAVGGAPCEAWIGRKAVECQLPHILDNWTGNDFIQPWVRERALFNMKKSSDIRSQRHPYEPCYLFEAGIKPLAHYPIRGVVWYQGESNAQNFNLHEQLFKMLVGDWRAYWQQPSMPFYYVQLSSMDRLPWQWFRDSQRRLLSEVPNVGMAVSSDMGDSLNVHPTRKQPVGERLARLALHNDYGFSALESSGPLVKGAYVTGDGIVRVEFDHAGSLATSDGREPLTFEVAEYEGLYHKAEARIEGSTVVVVSSEVAKPRYVRYGWQPFTRANLVNGEGLPASTFRIEVK